MTIIPNYFGSTHQGETISKITNHLVIKVQGKEQQYCGSWMKRGGVGAFMMLARKWDRIEVDSENHKYDILAAIRETAHKPDGLLDDIDDLIGYLLLVKAYHHDLEEVCNYNTPTSRLRDKLKEIERHTVVPKEDHHAKETEKSGNTR